MENHPHASVKTYLLVFAGLAALTGMTVVLSYISMPHNVAIMAAAAIAVLKCSLIIAFFMHMRFEGRAIYAVFFTGFILIGVLLLAILPDLALLK
jgi:cytochrome c oxidase subunit IV